MKQLVEVYAVTDPNEYSTSDLIRLYLDDSISEERLIEDCCSESDFDYAYSIIALNWWTDYRPQLIGRASYDDLILTLCSGKPTEQREFDDLLRHCLSKKAVY